METPTSFDLNEALRCWRAGLSQSPQLRAENLAELEAHLRDGVAAWQARGLTEEEAFLLAGSGQHGNGGSNQSLLECSHGNNLCCGDHG